MRPRAYRITQLLGTAESHQSLQLGASMPRASPQYAAEYSAQYSAELILEMLEVTLAKGVSLPRALSVLGSVLKSAEGECLCDVAERLSFGTSWDSAWKDARAESDLLGIVHDVLEPAYKRGASPTLRIENAIEQLQDIENYALSSATHELSVRILMPLGLCFLPGFVALTVVPLLSAWFGALG
ncbi:type II secretion protein F [Alloscardovia macacae]|uniref:Type II secretion protein F n=2 Tax=Alloscardovia macacae TaxID=1160091 RepID=A0A261F3Y6_9BIFI|nr:type II secretion protein F [Alloscardovia macacae]